jgi:drug/metabolite transporter (DMT)-like permease
VDDRLRGGVVTVAPAPASASNALDQRPIGAGRQRSHDDPMTLAFVVFGFAVGAVMAMAMLALAGHPMAKPWVRLSFIGVCGAATSWFAHYLAGLV